MKAICLNNSTQINYLPETREKPSLGIGLQTQVSLIRVHDDEGWTTIGMAPGRTDGGAGGGIGGPASSWKSHRLSPSAGPGRPLHACPQHHCSPRAMISQPDHLTAPLPHGPSLPGLWHTPLMRSTRSQSKIRDAASVAPSLSRAGLWHSPGTPRHQAGRSLQGHLTGQTELNQA